ncbi:DUF411 domain-containing protein [Aquibium sp. ELW1220]|jgi:hypothetical protein|uniref:DUF411 domain-containing protein n=1 Tax=Aquibium sp. ELW1220 TaxID=2976766 RepID=UPI0025B20186|nr:DUF411 domain-containing protein [Aquibium sp. ELW1220]MDN2578646.1 DUF411 domain-containing protein [Aquibium sp. ELW1220]
MTGNRSFSLRGTAFALGLLAAGAAQAATAIEVLKTASCGCCHAWVEYMAGNGFDVSARDLPMATLMSRKAEAGLRPGQTSCHTAFVEGYVIEGHVPAREVRRLLEQRPEAIGLSVPDMPYGSPGMGEPGPDADPYDVLLVRRDGTTEIFARYP